MRAAPPGDEAIGLALPTFAFEKRRDRLGESLLHVDDRAVLIERQCLDVASERLGRLHGVQPGRSRANRSVERGSTSDDSAHQAAAFIAAKTLSGVKGTDRSRTPIASNTAFEIAAG